MSTLVIRNARITTLDPQQPHAQALAVQEGRIVAVGSDEEIMRGWGNEATLIDAQGRRLLPGLNDSHTHLIRGGLNYNLELRWDGLRSLGNALDIDMTRLFMVGDAQQAAGDTPTVVKDCFEDVQRYETDQYLYSVLCGAFPGKKMQPLVAVINAREAGEFSETIRHAGQEFVMVLSGRVRILFENGESVELGRHEAAYFDSGVGHVYVSLSRQPAQVVSVCS